MQVLLITSQWPTPREPEKVPFLVQQVAFLRQAGIRLDVFAFRGYKNPINYLSAWRRLRRRVDIAAFDLVHAHFGQSGLLALPRQRPLVVTFHGSDLQGNVGPNGRYTLGGYINRQLSRLVARHADQRIVVANRLVAYLPAGRSAHLIPGGVDLERFRPLDQSMARRELGLPAEPRLVLFAADPARKVKRYNLAAQAVARLAPWPVVQLVTIANVQHDLVPLYMNACDVLLLTSRHEGSPTVVKEALACNLPVVSVNVGDVWQRLAGVPGCIVCEQDTPEDIAAALQQALRTPQRIPGRAHVRALDEHHVAQRIIEVYELALRGR